MYWGHDLDLSGSRDVISHLTTRNPIGGGPLDPSLYLYNGFRDIVPKTACAHRHDAKSSSLRMRNIT